MVHCSSESKSQHGSDAASFAARMEAFQDALSRHQHSGAHILAYLAHRASERLLMRIADHPNIDIRTLEELAEHSSSRVRLAAAENPRISAQTLQRLAYDEDPDLRYALAENHNLPA